MRKNPNQNAPKILGMFFVVTLVAGVAIYYFAEEVRGPRVLYGNLKGYFTEHRVERRQPVALASFGTLQDDISQGGVAQFQKKKEDLRGEVAENLREVDSPDRDKAENIAVYLFPDLLEKDDFEKDVALDQWAPHEKKIESNPHSPESRQVFEEMKNNVWNYENPDRETPVVSDYATQVLKIYEALSRSE